MKHKPPEAEDSLGNPVRLGSTLHSQASALPFTMRILIKLIFPDEPCLRESKQGDQEQVIGLQLVMEDMRGII